MVVQAPQALIAFTEAREGRCDDCVVNGIAMRRSTDGGQTWGPYIWAVSDESTDPSRPDMDVGGNPSAVYDAATGKVLLQFVRGTLNDPKGQTCNPATSNWQIESSDGQLFVSQSLIDQLLPRTEGPRDNIGFRNFTGPNDMQVRSIDQWIILDNGTIWNVQVASSMQGLEADRRTLRSNLLLGFGLVVITGVVGAFLQASATLRPLTDLRKDVLARWDSDDGLKVDKYPKEVAPLVGDINTLLGRNRDIVSRSRRQAADLAHAIKTPSAIVRIELGMLRQKGHDVQHSIDALDRLDAQLKRSFARMRADGANAAVQVFTDADVALNRFTRAFSTMASHQGKVLTSQIAPGLRVRIEQVDFEEIIGNLLDNSLKWAVGKMHIGARRDGDKVIIVIEDDGPGIPEQEHGAATRDGQRLDTSKDGTGLGLAIAADLTHAYGGELILGKSDTLGGLQARVILKTSGI
jgi:signal transduction histidine kinase